jgi:hypothetical protein
MNQGIRLFSKPIGWALSMASVAALAGCTSAQQAQFSSKPRLASGDQAALQERESPARRRGTPPPTPRDNPEIAPASSQLMVDDGPRRFVTPIARAGFPGTFDESLLRLKLVQSAVEVDFFNVEKKVHSFKYLSCRYEAFPTNPIKTSTTNVTVWLSSRPDLTGVSAVDVQARTRRLSGDVGLNRCPDTWGQALQIAWGPSAWADLQSHYQKYADANAARRRQSAELLEKQAQEEEKRKAAAKALTLAKFKKNAVPTVEDIQKLVTETSMEMTAKNNEGLKVVQTSSAGYEVLATAMGRTWKISTVTIGVSDLVCKPESGMHRCSYTETFDWVRYAMFEQVVRSQPTTSEKPSGLFKWQEDGLTSPKGKGPLVTNIGWTRGGSSGGAGDSTYTGRKENTADIYMQREQDNRQNYNDRNQGPGAAPYDPMKRY